MTDCLNPSSPLGNTRSCARALLLLLLLVMWVPASALVQVDGIYTIGTAQELAEFAELVSESETGFHAMLTADIDFRDYPGTMIGSSRQRPFQGIFDGDGHLITIGISTAETGDYSGALFRFACDATIRNLRLEGSVSTCGKHCASLISFASGTCSIVNVVSSVRLSSNSYDDCMGGFIGIAGENFDRVSTNVTFTNCAFTGSIVYTGEDAEDVNAIGRFAHHGGGFVGWKGISNSRVYLINCYSAPSEIQQSANFSPFVRYWSYKDIGIVYLRNCHYASNINYGQTTTFNLEQGHAATLSKFENGSLCSQLNVGYEMPVWRQRYGIDRYPVPTYIETKATQNGTCWITTADELEAFARLVSTSNPYARAILTADIDYRDRTLPIGSEEAPFLGIFDGNDHLVQVHFEDGQYAALFGCVGRESIVKNLHVDGTIDVKTLSGKPVGVAAGIVAHLKGGFVAGCLSTVDISVKGREPVVVGGIVGVGSEKAITSNCVYSGNLALAHHSDAGYIMGHATAAGVLPSAYVRNSIAFQSSPSPDGAFPLPLCGGVERNCHVEESFCISKENFYPSSVPGPRISQLSDGEVFQIIWDRQIFKTRETISEQEYHIKKNRFVLAIVVLTSLLVIITLMAAALYFKAAHLDLQRRFDNAMVQLEEWKRTLHQAREATCPVNSAEKAPSDGQADPSSASSPETENLRLRALYDRLLMRMDSEKLYCREDLDETTLARELGTNVKYLSQCIQQCDGHSFSIWLATYRINHALSLISANPLVDVMTLCHESGFASHSTFNRHFKNVIGMTAQQYIKMMRSEASSR